MNRQQYRHIIRAPRETVFAALIDPEHFKTWTAAFTEGSYYEGTWAEGETIRFLMTDKAGNASGMLSRIAEHRPPEYTSIKHIGLVTNGVDDTTSDEARTAVGTDSYETYTLVERDGDTDVIAEIDLPAEFLSHFDLAFPKALAALAAICEARE